MVIGRKAGESVMRGAHVFVPGMLAVSAGKCCADPSLHVCSRVGVFALPLCPGPT